MIEIKYKRLLDKVLLAGASISSDVERTGTGTIKIFGEMMKLDVSQNDFPILTSKYIHFKSIVIELLWMLSGSDNIKYLQSHGVRIWNEWADEDGSLNGVYGKQWRKWQKCDFPHDTIDQIENLISTIKENPNDRRQLVSAWNVDKISSMNLPPCHWAFQTCVIDDKEEGKRPKLNLMVHQRSVDTFLGLPFNLSSYSLLLCILAKLTDLEVGQLTWTGGDVHVYRNHLECTDKYLKNYSVNDVDTPTQLEFSDKIDFTSLDSFLETTLDHPERISLKNYKHMGKISAAVAV